MRKIISLLIGISVGVSLGAVLIAFFSPVSTDELKANLQQHYDKAKAAGREASAKRRAELEQELQQMQEA